MQKSYALFQKISDSWKIHDDLKTLFSIAHDRYDERIKTLETIINKLNACPKNPTTQSTIIKFELMLHKSRDEQAEANEKSNTNQMPRP